jgi:hypothetical protein
VKAKDVEKLNQMLDQVLGVKAKERAKIKEMLKQVSGMKGKDMAKLDPKGKLDYQIFLLRTTH